MTEAVKELLCTLREWRKDYNTDEYDRNKHQKRIEKDIKIFKEEYKRWQQTGQHIPPDESYSETLITRAMKNFMRIESSDLYIDNSWRAAVKSLLPDSEINILPDPYMADPLLDWIIPGLRPGMVGLLVAPGGTGKSYLALELGISVATGQSIFENIPIDKSGPVSLIFFEDDLIDVRMRSNRIARTLRAKGKPIPDATMYTCHSWVGKNLFLLDAAGNEITSNIEELTQICTGQRLVVLDPLTHLHQVDENNNLHATKMTGGCDIVSVSYSERHN